MPQVAITELRGTTLVLLKHLAHCLDPLMLAPLFCLLALSEARPGGSPVPWQELKAGGPREVLQKAHVETLQKDALPGDGF